MTSVFLWVSFFDTSISLLFPELLSPIVCLYDKNNVIRCALITLQLFDDLDIPSLSYIETWYTAVAQRLDIGKLKESRHVIDKIETGNNEEWNTWNNEVANN